MEESVSTKCSAYAIQIAVHTLRDRCKTLQQRIFFLEEENVSLRTKCNRLEETENSLSELDKMKAQVIELREQRDQLQESIKMVTNENQELWSKLGKLMRVNKNLNDQFNKINETLNQHTHPPTLLRSKTFTQNNPLLKHVTPKNNLELNENLSLELENISLKLLDSFSKQKIELENMCSEISEINCEDMITENFGFCFDDSLEDASDELNYVLEDLRMLKEEVLMHRNDLAKNLKNLQYLSSLELISCKVCDKRNRSKVDNMTSTEDIPKFNVDKSTETPQFTQKPDSLSQSLNADVEKVCPICSKHFSKEFKFEDFQQHVEDHFLDYETSFLD